MRARRTRSTSACGRWSTRCCPRRCGGSPPGPCAGTLSTRGGCSASRRRAAPLLVLLFLLGLGVVEAPAVVAGVVVLAGVGVAAAGRDLLAGLVDVVVELA